MVEPVPVAPMPSLPNDNQDSDLRARYRPSKLIYSDNMTLGLAIGSKSTWKDEKSSPRLLRKSQSTTDVLEKVLPTIPPWILVDPPEFKNQSLSPPPPLPSLSEFASAPASPPSPSSIRSPAATSPTAWSPQTPFRTPSLTAWSPQKPVISAKGGVAKTQQPLSSSEPPKQSHPYASSNFDHLSKIAGVVRNGRTRLPKVHNAFRCQSKSSDQPELDFEIVTPSHIMTTTDQSRKKEETANEKAEIRNNYSEKALPVISGTTGIVWEKGQEDVPEGRDESDYMFEDHSEPNASSNDDDDYDPDPDMIWTPSEPEPKPKPWLLLTEIYSFSKASAPYTYSEVTGLVKPLPVISTDAGENGPRPLPPLPNPLAGNSSPAPKHRPPMLVLAAPPTRSSSLAGSPMNRDLPSLPSATSPSKF